MDDTALLLFLRQQVLLANICDMRFVAVWHDAGRPIGWWLDGCVAVECCWGFYIAIGTELIARHFNNVNARQWNETTRMAGGLLCCGRESCWI